jgi:hypothetical protein
MSGTSPAVVLYSSQGVELDITPGTAVSGINGILMEGTDGTNARTILTDSSGRQYVNQGTPNTLANAWPVELTDGYGNLFGEPNNPIYVDGTINVVNLSVGAPGSSPPVDATYVGALTATSAPAYSTGLMEPFSLTLAGLLRVDGVYPVNATTPTTDVTFVGGAVTTAAPAYTTGQLSALSLTTGGLLRVDGTGGVFNNQSVGTDGAAFLSFDTQVGGRVTTAAPTYTTGQLSALSLDTSGNLRVLANQGTSPWVVSASGNFNNASVGATAAAPPADATYMGALVTTAAESGLTSGDMYSLNLTTTGALRIDGHYPTTTAIATAVDMGLVGGSVTTAAPTYTTATVNALSLDTSGNLRVTAITNKAGTAAITSVTVTASSATSLLAANSGRIFGSVYNNTNKNMFIALGSTANATTNFSILLITGSYWELPVDWTGSVSEFSPSGASGNVLVTELTS